MSSFCLHCGRIITPLNYKEHGRRSNQCMTNESYLAQHGFHSAAYKMDWSGYSARVRELMQ